MNSSNAACLLVGWFIGFYMDRFLNKLSYWIAMFLATRQFKGVLVKSPEPEQKSVGFVMRKK